MDIELLKLLFNLGVPTVLAFWLIRIIEAFSLGYLKNLNTYLKEVTGKFLEIADKNDSLSQEDSSIREAISRIDTKLDNLETRVYHIQNFLNVNKRKKDQLEENTND
ncbi:hypothetical protein [Gloeothece verrucosa]|uniref:Uncharacterized protein n=1 Tax=Gloeothece verrucosa (strain PCC 7822) TaxID=497965 RepID=E0UCB6_GLOV7|nr:hypothetical protein [Gloeothece verrucosa]ADN12873.1 hypothetical protein Cyan7822_0853 [Gloeothece verrucosa PCC 7822]